MYTLERHSSFPSRKKTMFRFELNFTTCVRAYLPLPRHSCAEVTAAAPADGRPAAALAELRTCGSVARDGLWIRAIHTVGWQCWGAGCSVHLMAGRSRTHPIRSVSPRFYCDITSTPGRSLSHTVCPLSPTPPEINHDLHDPWATARTLRDWVRDALSCGERPSIDNHAQGLGNTIIIEFAFPLHGRVVEQFPTEEGLSASLHALHPPPEEAEKFISSQ